MDALTLTRSEAAELCHLTPSGFDSWVKRGIVPGPLPGTRRWSRAALTNALNGGAADRREPESVFERWKQANAG
jgi:hypothetical protein